MTTPPEINTNYTRKDFGNPIIQIILMLIVLVLFSWFILLPKVKQYKEVKANIAASTNELSKIKKDQEDLNQLITKLRNSSDKVALIDEALPLNGRMSKAYVLFDNLVRSSGMSMASFNVSETLKPISAGDKKILENQFQEPRKLNTITMTASTTGTMDQLRNFLQQVETNGRVLDVQSIEIVSGEDLAKFNLIVKAYSYEK